MDVARAAARRMPAMKPVGEPDAGNRTSGSMSGEGNRIAQATPRRSSTLLLNLCLACLIALPVAVGRRRIACRHTFATRSPRP